MQLGSDDGVIALGCTETAAGSVLSESKVRYSWVVSIDGEKHQVDFTNSKTSGKKRVFVNGRQIYEQKVFRSPNFHYTWPVGNHLFSITPVDDTKSHTNVFSGMKEDLAGQVDCKFDLSINGLPFRTFNPTVRTALDRLRLRKFPGEVRHCEQGAASTGFSAAFPARDSVVHHAGGLECTTEQDPQESSPALWPHCMEYERQIAAPERPTLHFPSDASIWPSSPQSLPSTSSSEPWCCSPKDGKMKRKMSLPTREIPGTQVTEAPPIFCMEVNHRENMFPKCIPQQLADGLNSCHAENYGVRPPCPTVASVSVRSARKDLLKKLGI